MILIPRFGRLRLLNIVGLGCRGEQGGGSRAVRERGLWTWAESKVPASSRCQSSGPAECHCQIGLDMVGSMAVYIIATFIVCSSHFYVTPL